LKFHEDMDPISGNMMRYVVWAPIGKSATKTEHCKRMAIRASPAQQPALQQLSSPAAQLSSISSAFHHSQLSSIRAGTMQ